MITKETLLAFARVNNLRPWQQEKHYIQTLVLIALSDQQIVFKGGTYLWFFHGLNRFSEDLDFTAVGELPNDLGRKVSEILRMFGIENTVKLLKNDGTTFSFRISARGPLCTSDIDLCHVRVEISRREKILATPLPLELSIDAYGLPVKIISGMSLDEVAAEKVRGILARETARDIYDLFFLIEKKGVKFDLGMITKKLDYYDLSFSQKKFAQKLILGKKRWKELEPLVIGKPVSASIAVKTIKRWTK